MSQRIPSSERLLNYSPPCNKLLSCSSRSKQQIIETIFNESSYNSIFNVGGETFSLKEVAESVAKNYNITVENIIWPKVDLQLESGDTVFNSNKIEYFSKVERKFKLLNWINNQ